MIWFILAIILGIIAIVLHKSANDNSSFVSEQTNQTTPLLSYGERYKRDFPTKTAEIEKLLNINIESLSEKDIKEKVSTLERFCKRQNCKFSEIKNICINNVSQQPIELVPQMIETAKRGKIEEANKYNISQENTFSALMVLWLQEYYNQNASSQPKETTNKDELEIAKIVFPDLSDTQTLKERAISLREMTALLHCSPLNLHEFCNTHLKQGYDGTFKDFYKLIELYKHMAYQSYEIAPKVGVEPSNTSYGILCYWLDDIMKEERQKFFDTKEAECPICRSHDVKLGLFKDNFECNNCKQEFGGL